MTFVGNSVEIRDLGGGGNKRCFLTLFLKLFKLFVIYIGRLLKTLVTLIDFTP